MSIQLELKTVLKRLKLSAMLATLPDRVAFARKEKLDYAQFLELVLSDEVERREQKQTSRKNFKGERAHSNHRAPDEPDAARFHQAVQEWPCDRACDARQLHRSGL